MEKYCVSLEIAKKLKDAGWKKETEFWWEHHFKEIDNGQGVTELISKIELNSRSYVGEFYPAPISGEILEELPATITKDGFSAILEIRIHNNTKDVCYYHPHLFFAETDKSLPNALAKMFIYLKSNNLLEGGKG